MPCTRRMPLLIRRNLPSAKAELCRTPLWRSSPTTYTRGPTHDIKKARPEAFFPLRKASDRIFGWHPSKDAKLHQGEVRRIPLLRGWVNKGPLLYASATRVACSRTRVYASVTREGTGGQSSEE